MERKYDHNSAIIYVDPHGTHHSAIVTSWWGVAGASYGGDPCGSDPAPHGYAGPNGEPGCNLVFVDKEAAKIDPYGRQISRSTSVVHKSKQPAHGNYWCWPDEVTA